MDHLVATVDGNWTFHQQCGCGIERARKRGKEGGRERQREEEVEQESREGQEKGSAGGNARERLERETG